MTKRYRVIALLLGVIFLFALAGCGNAGVEAPLESMPQKSAPETTPQASAQSTAPGTVAGDTLVVYFSRTGEQFRVGVIDKGNTAVVAEMIAEAVDADTYEVLPADDHYPMTYDELTDVAKEEQNANARPDYVKTVPDLSRYQTIFIGAPVWWGDWPMIMYTFFENEDLSGKTLIPFSTHEGSGLAGFDKKLAAAVPGSEVRAGLAVRGEDCQKEQESVEEAVKSWLGELGY